MGKAFPYYVHIWLGEGDDGVGGRAEGGYIEFNHTSIKLLIFFFRNTVQDRQMAS